MPLDLFDGFSYTALGHLHGRQSLVPGRAGIQARRWPIRSRKPSTKRAAGSLTLTSPGSPPCRRSCGRRRGNLPSSAAPSRSCWSPADHAWAEDAYCQVTLTDAQRPAQAMERLRARFPDTLVLGFRSRGGTRRLRGPATAAGWRRRGRPLGLLRIPGARPRPGAGRRGAGRPHRSLGERAPAGGITVRIHRLEISAFGPVRRHRGNRFRPAQRPRAVPAQRPHRRRQDQRAGRHLLCPLRFRARRAAGRQATAQRPRGLRRRTPRDL